MTQAFARFRDDLLLAMVNRAPGGQGEFMDPITLAKTERLSYLPGWVRLSIEAMQSRGLVEGRNLFDGTPDGQIMVRVTGSGMERAAEIAVERAGESVTEAPAADRFVRIDHNSADYKKADDTLAQTIEAVRGNNEFANNDPEDYEQRLAELEAGTRLLQARRINPGWLKAGLLPALRYIAKKFADNAIGALATAAVAALLLLFHSLL
jgi:hypothetical protein